MKKIFTLLVILAAAAVLAWFLTHHASRTNTTNDEAEIRQLLKQWAKAFSAHDVDGVMSMYAPEVTAYDIVPPLQFVGSDAYRKDYEDFLAQYEGPIEVEFRDLKVATGDSVAFAHGLQRFRGTLKNGQKFDLWFRFTSCFRKRDGQWLDIHDHISVPSNLENGTAALDLKP